MSYDEIKNYKYIYFLFFVLILANGCGRIQQKFDSEKWKLSDKSVRGAMTEDLAEGLILAGKSGAEIEEILGKPDIIFDGGWGYEVRTVNRCYIWKCTMEVEFDKKSNKATGKVLVSN